MRCPNSTDECDNPGCRHGGCQGRKPRAPKRLVPRRYDADADATGSYYAAVAEIGRRVKSGEEAAPTGGYFRARERDKSD